MLSQTLGHGISRRQHGVTTAVEASVTRPLQGHCPTAVFITLRRARQACPLWAHLRGPWHHRDMHVPGVQHEGNVRTGTAECCKYQDGKGFARLHAEVAMSLM